MQDEFWESSEPMFAATREEALKRLTEFSQKASRYSRDRNHVVPGHKNVSRLSPAIRHRLISEKEAAQVVLERYAFSTVEKFLQEIYWRRYWKSWLAMRPQVWTEYLTELEELKASEQSAKADEIEKGCGPVAMMNEFSRELVETGYLHNHARMWFAGYWIHTLRLPWQLGADFFYRHLLDADPASNTLSWRWVAGLQTPGKTYVARRSNMEKYLHPDLLLGREKGMDLLESPSAVIPDATRIPAELVKREDCERSEGKSGLWVHEEDLNVDDAIDERELIKLDQVLVTGDIGLWERQSFSKVKTDWLKVAIDDAGERLSEKIPDRVVIQMTRSLVDSLVEWVKKHKLQQVIAYRPEVGFLDDQIPALRKALAQTEVSLLLLDHHEDEDVQTFAKGGFFSFWKKVETYVRSLKQS